MSKLPFLTAGLLVIGLVAGVNAAPPLPNLIETFEDDAVGSLPSAYGPAYYGNNSLVVATGTDDIASPDGSMKYAKFVGPLVSKLGASYWFNDKDVKPPILALDNCLAADFYIDPAVPVNTNVYLATTFYFNGLYSGEVGLGYTLPNDGSGKVVFHVTRYGNGHQGEQPTAVTAGWYHLEMIFADANADCMLEVTGTISDAAGTTVYTYVEPTEFAANDTYRTAGYQIQAGEIQAGEIQAGESQAGESQVGEPLFVPLRVDNLMMYSFKTVSLTVIGQANKRVKVSIGAVNIVAANLGGVDYTKLQEKPDGTTMAEFPTKDMVDGVFVGKLADGTLIRGEIPFPLSL